MKKQDSSQPPTVAIALTAGFFMVAGLIAMTAVVIPGVLLMVVGGFALLLTFVAQYFLWARWMFPIVQRWEREKENRLADVAKPLK